MKLKKQLVALGLLLASASAVIAQQTSLIPIDPKVRMGKLDNGLTYYIRYNNYPEGQVNFYIAQKVGSVLEEDDQRGLAHFLEHMCFNGTEKFPGNGVVKYLEGIGVKFGAELNAYTSIDETVYNIDNVPANVAGAIDSCLWILHDWAGALLLEDKEIDKERGVIHEEWRGGHDATERMLEQILPNLYPDGNRYGHRLPIGTMEVVDNFPYSALRNYYEKWYRPDQQGIIVVGDVDVDEIESKIKSIFADLRMPENLAERVYYPVADNKEPIIATAKDKEQQYGIVYIFNKHEVFPNDKKCNMEYMHTSYAQMMFSIMMWGRMSELSMRADAPFVESAVSDDVYFVSKTKGAVNGFVVPKDGMVKEAIAALYREMLRVQRHGFTESEYNRARAEYLTVLESAYNERDKVESQSYCGEYVRHFIDNEPIPGIEAEYALTNQFAPTFTVDMVNRYVQSIMSDSNLVVMSMLPDKKKMPCPTDDEIKQLLVSVASEDIPAYVDRAAGDSLIGQIPAVGEVVKTKKSHYGYKQLTLSNGVTVYLKHTDYKADEVIMHVVSKGGQAQYDESEHLNLDNVADVIENNGIGKFNSTDLQKVLAGKMAYVSPYVNMYTEGLKGYCTPKDFVTMMQLTHLQFTAPRLDDEAFAAYKSKMVSLLENQEQDPMTSFRDTTYSVLYGNHPRMIRTKAADVEKICDTRILEIYKERFANAADFEFIFTGAIDETTAIPLIEKYIGSLPTGGKAEKYQDVRLEIQKGKHKTVFERQVETPDATVLLTYSGKVKYNLKNNLLMDITSQILDIVYTEEIREKEGGTYGVVTNGEISNVPNDRASLEVYFKTGPEKREHLTNMAIDLLYQYAEKGPRQEDLDKVREYMQKKYVENQKENAYWSNLMLNYLLDDYDGNKDYMGVLNSITVDDLKKFVKNLLKQGNMIEVSMIGVK